MKRLIVFGSAAALCLMTIGCGSNTPENAAESFVKKNTIAANGVKLDLSKISYSVDQAGETSAIVLVEGDAPVKGKIKLEKIEGKWKVAE